MYGREYCNRKQCQGKHLKRKKAKDSKQTFSGASTDKMNTSSSSSASSEKSRYPSGADEQEVLHVKCKEGERVQCPVDTCKAVSKLY